MNNKKIKVNYDTKLVCVLFLVLLGVKKKKIVHRAIDYSRAYWPKKKMPYNYPQKKVTR
jgi:hypothetical protein